MASNSLIPYNNFGTNRFHGHCVKFSPLEKDIVAVCGAENFGIEGAGALMLFDISARNPFIRAFNYKDALFDLSWVSKDENVIITGSGCGSVQIWAINKSYTSPYVCKKIHEREVSSVQNPEFYHEYFTTTSWDSSINVCDINAVLVVSVLKGHRGMVHESCWSPIVERNLASVSEDGHAILWNPFVSDKPILAFPSSGSELLSCDWSPSNHNLLVTASASALVIGWDIRHATRPVFHLQGHENAVRKVRFSPSISTELISVSYDFSTRLWDLNSGSEVSVARCHSEFVYGLDYSRLNPGLVADCAWDKSVQLYRIGPSHSLPGPSSTPHRSATPGSSSGRYTPSSSEHLVVDGPPTPPRHKPLPPTPLNKTLPGVPPLNLLSPVRSVPPLSLMPPRAGVSKPLPPIPSPTEGELYPPPRRVPLDSSVPAPHDIHQYRQSSAKESPLPPNVPPPPSAHQPGVSVNPLHLKMLAEGFRPGITPRTPPCLGVRPPGPGGFLPYPLHPQGRLPPPTDEGARAKARPNSPDQSD